MPPHFLCSRKASTPARTTQADDVPCLIRFKEPDSQETAGLARSLYASRTVDSLPLPSWMPRRSDSDRKKDHPRQEIFPASHPERHGAELYAFFLRSPLNCPA